MRWHEVTAVFGGTFDPPHLGHREAVRGLFQAPGVQRVLVIPSATPPHKPGFAPAEQRIEMARRCFAGPGLEEVRLDLRELERAVNNPDRPSYSFDTISELKREYPRLAFVIGADQLAKLPSWHRFPELLDLCHWIVLERKPDGNKIALEALREWIASGLIKRENAGAFSSFRTRGDGFLTLCPTEAPRISSTEIREKIARNGQPPEHALPPEVIIYLKMHRVYGTSSENF